jgi:hypothetical protein
MAFTSHGHHIPFTFLEAEKPEKVEGCGGVRLCLPCTIEAMPHMPAFQGERGKAYLKTHLKFEIVTVAG